MKIEEIKELIKTFIDEPIINFQIEKQLFDSENGREIFNERIRNNVDKKTGVYVWVNSSTKEVVYIGMAGKIKTNGTIGSHSLQNRLLASRGKNKETKEDIQTNDFVKNIMNNYDIKSLDFYVMYSKVGEPSAYIEALLLYKYYKQKNKLPMLNSSF